MTGSDGRVDNFGGREKRSLRSDSLPRRHRVRERQQRRQGEPADRATSPGGFDRSRRRTAASPLVDVDVVFKVNEGRPNIADQIVNRKIDLVINTPLGRESFFDDRTVRRAAMMHEVACITTLTGAAAAVSAIRGLRQQGFGVRALQDYYAGIAAGSL
jgi:hypothetical protein